jgi:hypothetical protein
MTTALRATPGRYQPAGAIVLALTLMLTFASLGAHADARDQAKRIHDRIAGVPPDANDLNLMTTMIQSDANQGPLDAAMFATTNPAFYNVTLKNFAAPWTNRDQAVFVPLNDYTATIIGAVREDYDFRRILFDDILFVGAPGPAIPAYSTTSNANYEALENTGADLSNASVLVETTQSSVTGLPPAVTAGIITTRAAAKAFFIAGTNRAMFRFTMLNHLCRDMEQVHDISRSPDRIRQDVSRSPGGDSRVFLNNCIGCHSGMDPMAQAFAYYNFQYDKTTDPDGNAGFLKYNNTGDVDAVTGTRVVAKYFNNNLTFPDGYITLDDHWDNYWRNGPNAVLGWNGSLAGSGDGAKSLGQELANSDAFAQCQVEKVFENVCLRAPSDQDDRDAVATMVGEFATDNYNLRKVFARAAVYCMGN